MSMSIFDKLLIPEKTVSRYPKALTIMRRVGMAFQGVNAMNCFDLQSMTPSTLRKPKVVNWYHIIRLEQPSFFKNGFYKECDSPFDLPERIDGVQGSAEGSLASG